MPTHAKKSLLRSVAVKLIALAGVTAVFFAGAAVWEEISKKRSIQSEIDKLQQEAEKISRQNITLEEKIAYLESREYQEKEAKDKLSLQSLDENLVVIKPSIAREIGAVAEKPSVAKPSARIEDSPPNYIKWWNYFFKY